MRKTFAYLFSIIFLHQISAYSYSSNPKDFVNELVNDAIAQLSDKNLDKAQKASFIENIAIDHVDINALSLYTLGELRKSADKTDIDNYKEKIVNLFLFLTKGKIW